MTSGESVIDSNAELVQGLSSVESLFMEFHGRTCGERVKESMLELERLDPNG